MTGCEHRPGSQCASCRVYEYVCTTDQRDVTHYSLMQLVEAAEADARREIAEKCARMVTSSFGLRCSADGELNDLANAMRARAAEEG